MNVLEKEVKKTADKIAEKEENFVKEVKLLLTSNAAEERQVLDGLGLTTAMKVVENKNGKILEKRNLSTKLGKTVISIRDAQELCLKYRLYMRPANKYKGTIPPDLGAELRRFCEEKKIPVPSHSDHSRFYIIAPPKMFVDYKSGGELAKEFVGVAEESIKMSIDSVMRTFKGDPILVYHEGENLAVIKSWGEDFAPLRRIMGILTRKATMMWTNFIFNSVLVFFAIRGIAAPWIAWGAEMENNAGPCLAAIGIDIVIVTVMCLWLVGCSDARKWLILRVTSRNEGRKTFWSTGSHYSHDLNP